MMCVGGRVCVCVCRVNVESNFQLLFFASRALDFGPCHFGVWSVRSGRGVRVFFSVRSGPGPYRSLLVPVAGVNSAKKYQKRTKSTRKRPF